MAHICIWLNEALKLACTSRILKLVHDYVVWVGSVLSFIPWVCVLPCKVNLFRSKCFTISILCLMPVCFFVLAIIEK